MVFEEGDADVAEVAAALLVDHVDYVLKILLVGVHMLNGNVTGMQSLNSQPFTG